MPTSRLFVETCHLGVAKAIIIKPYVADKFISLLDTPSALEYRVKDKTSLAVA